METVVISAYTACGKTYAAERFKEKYKIIDSDIHEFSFIERRYTDAELQEKKKQWNSEPHLLDGDGYINFLRGRKVKVRNPDFPKNYVEYIKENIGKVDVIFVSSDLEVRKAMTEAGIKFCTVYPREDMLNEWIGRMFKMGKPKELISIYIHKWNVSMNNIETEPFGKILFRIGSNDYIDVEKILKEMRNKPELITPKPYYNLSDVLHYVDDSFPGFEDELLNIIHVFYDLHISEKLWINNFKLLSNSKTFEKWKDAFEYMFHEFPEIENGTANVLFEGE